MNPASMPRMRYTAFNPGVFLQHAALLVIFLVFLSYCPTASAYDPLDLSLGEQVLTLDTEVQDIKRKRTIPVYVYYPEIEAPAPVILFSHGLGGSRHNNAYAAEHWTKRGYVVVVIQHPGSDESVWKDKSALTRIHSMRQAASIKNFLLRVKDVSAVMDALALWNNSKVHPLSGRMELNHIGMSGHSFGAITAQAVSGQKLYRVGTRFTDSRIKSMLAMSPSPPTHGISAKEAFSSVKIPWMLMTGSEDDAPIGNQTPKSRLEVFPALPEGNKFELVLKGADHFAFSDRQLKIARERNPNHHRVILALSTAFWDMTLNQDPDAEQWLQSGGAEALLESGDSWKKK